MYKRYIHQFIMGFTFNFLILVLLNYIVDPFQIYRKVIFHKTIFVEPFYIGAGLIKNYDFDSISIGSSVTANFIINDLKKSKFQKIN